MSRFWGQRVEPGTVVEMALEDISLHLSQAALAPGAKGTSVLFARTAKTDGAFALCQLTAGKQPHTTIDLTFFPGDERVDLIVQGDAAVHVTGMSMVEMEDEDEEGEGEEGSGGQAAMLRALAALRGAGGGEEDDEDDEEGEGEEDDDDEDYDSEGEDDEQELTAEQKALVAMMVQKFARGAQAAGDDEEEEEEEGEEEEDEAAVEEPTTSKHARAAAAADASAQAQEPAKLSKAQKRKLKKQQAAAKEKGADDATGAQQKRVAQEQAGPDSKKRRTDKPANGGTEAAAAGDATSVPRPKPMTITKGLVATDVAVGHGTVAKPGRRVTVHYTGRLKNGTVFDSSEGKQPFSFRLGLGEVISGWEKGVANMRVGGVRKLSIAPKLGYGSQRVGSIPPNSTLEFEVKLLGVK